ncbi:MAG: helix-turn-helix transcriptional regulator [Oscillospiraceae bacterium]
MLSEKIVELRKSKKSSERELARRSGHPVSSISNIERGIIKNPRFRIIIDLANALEVSLDELAEAFQEDEK